MRRGNPFCWIVSGLLHHKIELWLAMTNTGNFQLKITIAFVKPIEEREFFMSKIYKPLIDEDGEVRPLTASDMLRAVPLRDVFPELAEFSEKRKVGRPKSANPKKSKTFKLSPALIDAIVATGKGYNASVEAILQKAVHQGLV